MLTNFENKKIIKHVPQFGLRMVKTERKVLNERILEAGGLNEWDEKQFYTKPKE